MPQGKLYLIPVPIGDAPVYESIPAYNKEVIASLDYFVVENLRTARRFLSASGAGNVIDDTLFAELNEHTPASEIDAMIAPVLQGRSCGLMSEAGVPAVADPGAGLVALAHRRGVEVVPLVGPSSIVLALMSSGMNGQSFAFNGYLPVKPPQRSNAIRSFERRALAENQTQIFIEAPYRNLSVLQNILEVCSPDTLLSVSVDLMQPSQLIRTARVGEWKKHPLPDINKRPAIFIIGR